ncbi:MAG: PKD domain-containing protein [Chitinophagaceae bacterium]|nr:PKD domain-containing protein [Chitinophagaceae bacterium]
MRKLYALLAGLCLALTATYAGTPAPDVANFTSIVDHPNKNVVFTNTSVLGNEPGIRKAFWSFGDGSGTVTGPLQSTQHHYQHPGTYNVCLKIYRYRPNLNDSVLSAQVCKSVVIQTICRADFERLPVTVSPDGHLAVFKALPWHNDEKKPARICWDFGDGRDTCIQYPATFSGNYTVAHRYTNPGLYEVCVKINYYGGCEARKCKPVIIIRPDTCGADFERLPVTTANPLRVNLKAIPSHNNNKKPVQVCWQFGDGNDTCINYPTTYTGLYGVSHQYQHPGLYEVCVKIKYDGGCEARKCRPIQVGRPDTCGADFERLNISPAGSPLSTVFKALPHHNNNRKPARVCWQFGDGRDTCINYPETYTGLYTVGHQYQHPGLYEVCVKINYYGGCEARKCKPIQIGRPDTCGADFERLNISPAGSPLTTIFKALPHHNNNRKPARVCWQFGDGRDTCINYPETYTGLYTVGHQYQHPGLYEVCVKINYYGGCEARKCKPVQIGRPDSCRADFERIPVTATTPPHVVGFRALPWHNNDRKPQSICWRFGDGTDTCITYTNSYTGPYTVFHRYMQPGTYQVCVKINYYGGCEANKCKPVVVPPVVSQCRVNLFEITPSITSLVRGFFAVPHSVPDSNRPVRICWNFGDGTDTCWMLNPASPLPSLLIRHTYPGPGNYRACVRVLFRNGCVAEDCRQVEIRPATTVCGGFMTDSLAGPRTFKFKGFSIHNPNDEPVLFRWTFGDGTSALGREVTHTYTAGGNYEVCLTIKTRLGCETRICKTVRVPGNNTPALTLNPNPVHTNLAATFFSTHNEAVSIRILNQNGVPVRSYLRNAVLGNNTWTFDLSSLTPGVYSFVVQSPNQLASAIFIKI